jgi:hypothetical protein
MWSAEKILYLRIFFAIDQDGNLTLQYGRKSGTFPIGTGINYFISQVLAGAAGSPAEPLPSGSTPLIEYPSYVVFHIYKSGNGEFRNDYDAISCDDAKPGEYFNLIHVRDDGSQVPGPGLDPNGPPAPPSPYNCHVGYFCAISPSTVGRTGQSDHFNLYVNFPQEDGSLLQLTVDPDIKNTGHTVTGVPGSSNSGAAKETTPRA